MPLFSLVFVIGAHGQEAVAGKSVLQAKEILPYGGADLVNNQLELISSAVHFGFSFEGSECEIYATVPDWMDHNYLQYELDGVYQKRVKISKD
ncbi:MAG: hypothetical protein J7502_16545 [Flavisolibacter sp.]|nr:hypothetical protein [Flavisolibacter sp.]